MTKQQVIDYVRPLLEHAQLDPANVRYVGIEPMSIAFEIYDRNDNGQKFIDPETNEHSFHEHVIFVESDTLDEDFA